MAKSSTPTLSIIGSNTILANQTLLGPNSRLRLGNLVDAGGVGFSEVQCYKNGQSSPTIYTSITDITPSGAPGQSDNYTISCRIKDQVGNYGPYTNFSGVVDLTKPTINYAPAQGSTITDNTTLTITSTDDKINGSSTATITWTSSDGSATWNTTVNYNGTWTGTLNGLNANLTDGTITATINAQDWAGNQRTDTINSWTLNTTTATSIFALNYSTGMVKVGNYLSPTVRFSTPPTGGSFTTTTQHSTLGQIGSHPTPETTQESWGWPGSSSSLTSGQI